MLPENTTLFALSYRICCTGEHNDANIRKSQRAVHSDSNIPKFINLHHLHDRHHYQISWMRALQLLSLNGTRQRAVYRLLKPAKYCTLCFPRCESKTCGPSYTCIIFTNGTYQRALHRLRLPAKCCTLCFARVAHPTFSSSFGSVWYRRLPTLMQELGWLWWNVMFWSCVGPEQEDDLWLAVLISGELLWIVASHLKFMNRMLICDRLASNTRELDESRTIRLTYASTHIARHRTQTHKHATDLLIKRVHSAYSPAPRIIRWHTRTHIHTHHIWLVIWSSFDLAFVFGQVLISLLHTRPPSKSALSRYVTSEAALVEPPHHNKFVFPYFSVLYHHDTLRFALSRPPVCSLFYTGPRTLILSGLTIFRHAPHRYTFEISQSFHLTCRLFSSP